MAVFFVITAWGLLIGWGTDNVGAMGESANNPTFVLAQHFWGGAWVIVVLALINSVIAFSIATATVTTRMLYSMSRSGAAPRALGELHPVHRSPTNAILLQTAITIVVGFIAAALLGPSETFVFLGLMVTFSLIFIYLMGNLGAAIVGMRGQGRSAAAWIRNLTVPIVASVMLVWLGYKSLSPFPPNPLSWAPIIVGIWLVLGCGLVLYMRSTGRESTLIEMGRMTQVAEPTDEPERV
jgi:amino acid transporter